jgi:hypothetical protein
VFEMIFIAILIRFLVDMFPSIALFSDVDIPRIIRLTPIQLGVEGSEPVVFRLRGADARKRTTGGNIVRGRTL